MTEENFESRFLEEKRNLEQRELRTREKEASPMEL